MDLSVAVKQVNTLGTASGAGSAGVAAYKESQKVTTGVDGALAAQGSANINVFGWEVKRETANLVAVIVAGLAVYVAYREYF